MPTTWPLPGAFRHQSRCPAGATADVKNRRMLAEYSCARSPVRHRAMASLHAFALTGPGPFIEFQTKRFVHLLKLAECVLKSRRERELRTTKQ